MPWGQLCLGILHSFLSSLLSGHCHSKCIITKYSSVIKVLFLSASFVFSWLLGSSWKWVYNHLLQLCSLLDSCRLSKVSLINATKIVPFALSLWYYHPNHLLCTLDLYITKHLSFLLPSLFWVLLKLNACSQLILSSCFQPRVCRIKYTSHSSAPWFYSITYNFFNF